MISLRTKAEALIDCVTPLRQAQAARLIHSEEIGSPSDHYHFEGSGKTLAGPAAHFRLWVSKNRLLTESAGVKHSILRVVTGICKPEIHPVHRETWRARSTKPPDIWLRKKHRFESDRAQFIFANLCGDLLYMTVSATSEGPALPPLGAMAIPVRTSAEY